MLLRFFAVLIGIVFANCASAAIVFTQDQAAFNAATSGLAFTTETFDSVTDGALTSTESFNGFSISANNSITGQNPSAFCLSGGCISFGRTDVPYTITFDSPVNAVGFFLGSGDNLSSDLLVDGVSAGTITTSTSYVFVGVYDLASTFASLTVVDELTTHDLENVSFATVPEPSTLALLGVGLLGLGLLRRKTRPNDKVSRYQNHL